MGFTGKLNGQWVGRYSGPNEGSMVLELDDFGTFYEGRAYAFDANPDLPNFVAVVKTDTKLSNFQVKGKLQPLHPGTGLPTLWADLQQLYPEVGVPSEATMEFMVVAERLHIKFLTDAGRTYQGILNPSRASDPSDFKCRVGVTTWPEFRSYVAGLPYRKCIFRGQDKQLRLRTSFHRTGRADLARFMNEDVPTLHRHLGSQMQYNFRLSSPEEQWAFLNLIQHHGYPTPLLDWTYSPYIAAFFAFTAVTRDREEDPKAKVRLHVFDAAAWLQRHEPVTFLAGRRPHISIMEFTSLNNSRLVPQQAVSMATNLDDIELWLASGEFVDSCEYLQVIDLPASERPTVMRELSLMGITAGSLFPGLDGTCAELKERMFPR